MSERQRQNFRMAEGLVRCTTGQRARPRFFLIFINDLDSAVTAKQSIKKFADDTKIMQVIESEEDAAEL